MAHHLLPCPAQVLDDDLHAFSETQAVSLNKDRARVRARVTMRVRARVMVRVREGSGHGLGQIDVTSPQGIEVQF